MCQQYTSITKEEKCSHTLEEPDPADEVLFFHLAKVRLHIEYGVQFGAPSSRWMLRNWNASIGATKMASGIQQMT